MEGLLYSSCYSSKVLCSLPALDFFQGTRFKIGRGECHHFRTLSSLAGVPSLVLCYAVILKLEKMCLSFITSLEISCWNEQCAQGLTGTECL